MCLALARATRRESLQKMNAEDALEVYRLELHLREMSRAARDWRCGASRTGGGIHHTTQLWTYCELQLLGNAPSLLSLRLRYVQLHPSAHGDLCSRLQFGQASILSPLVDLFHMARRHEASAGTSSHWGSQEQFSVRRSFSKGALWFK